MDSVVKICQAMIQAKSYSGEENQMAKVTAAYMKEAGFDQVDVDIYGNVVGVMTGSQPGPTQLYDAHMDTVPVPDESAWTYPPFEGAMDDGKIYGRGTSDMKGALAAMISAGAELKEKTGGSFKGKICVAGVVHEECFEGVAARQISKTYQPDVVIIGEASSLNLKHGQRGRCELVVETFGKPAHSANPEVGINAVSHMTEVIQALEKIPYEEDPILGKGILVLTDIISSPYPGASVVPSHCRTTWDRRLLVGETAESVLAPVEAILKKLEEEKGIKSKASIAEASMPCYTGSTIGGKRFFPGWLYDHEEAFVLESLKALQGLGLESQLSHYDFCTNGSHYAGEAGIKTIGFGPSRENLAHTIDEYIEIEQLEKAREGYIGLMGTLAEIGKL